MSVLDLLAGKPGDDTLHGRRVLVVEDEYLAAEDLCEELLRWGAEVMGPVATTAAALTLLETGPEPGLAILDIGLGDELVFPLAQVLRARDIPFVFVTGYDASVVPSAYANVPRIEKPVALKGTPPSR